MPNRITATELARALSDILNRVRYRGESFVIDRNGESVAFLTPSGPFPVTMRDVIAKVGDLRAPGDGFADELESVQRSQGRSTPPPWDI